MAPDRLSFATTFRLESRSGGEGQAEAREKVVVEIGSEPHPRPGDVTLTSRLSYVCRYCVRTHYPFCR
jgi:hypothetical protein